MKFKIALIQTELKFGERNYNLDKLEDFIRRASKDGANIIVLPESCNIGYRDSAMAQMVAMAETEDDVTITRMKSLAKELGVYLIVPILIRQEDGCRNVAFLLNDKGESMGCYAKSHLVPPNESAALLGGDRYPVFDTKYGRIGMIICNDLCHPEAARLLGIQNIDMLFVPAAWRYAGDWGYWLKFMAQTRAVENGGIVVGICNRVGVEDGVPFSGQSVLVNPNGTIAAFAEFPKDEIVMAEFSLEKMRDYKKNVAGGNMGTDRRPYSYGALCDPVCVPEFSHVGN